MATKASLDFMGKKNARKRTARKAKTTRTARKAGATGKRAYTRRRTTTYTGSPRGTSVTWNVPANPRKAFQLGLALGQMLA